jgi:hypothetical protein
MTPAHRAAPMIGLRVGLLLALLTTSLARPLAAQDGPPVRLPQATAATAWEQSLALENRGDFAGAKQLLIEAFGASPATYEVAVRLAWLTLRQNKGAEATELYRRARTMPGSLPEATTGLGLALTALGYNRLERGALGEARNAWSEALSIDASNDGAHTGVALLGGPPGVSAEGWYANIRATANASQAQVYYLQIPVRLDNESAIRFAVRSVTSPTFTGSSGAFAEQTEFYGAVSREIGISTTELIGFGFTSTGRSNSGVAVSTRIGGNYGVAATASMIARTGGNNLQIAPSAFAWLTPNIAIGGGVRITSDSSFSAVSPTASLTVRYDRFTVDLAGHFGKEQWAFSPAGPTILSFLDQTTGGLTGTASRELGHGITVYGQLQFEQTASSGSFQSVGLGVRIAPR